ncbi:hypothetical protein AABB24_002459 [Solanum stoloniferum]|uniref:RRM domain-containing protein n=1 Tax=Solanum stoloniferum TaxID=62892 RepID=A0ABD2VPP7_9SOLN
MFFLSDLLCFGCYFVDLFGSDVIVMCFFFSIFQIINDRETGRSRGFGFVTFKDEQAMRDAIEGMNGQDLDGRNITVNEAQSRGGGGGDRYSDRSSRGGGGGSSDGNWRN